MFPYLFPLVSPSLPPSLSHPSRWSQSTELISLVLCGCFPLAIYHMTQQSHYWAYTLRKP